MGAEMEVEDLLNKKFPMNALCIADELVRMSKTHEFGSAWMARGAEAICLLLQKIESQ